MCEVKDGISSFFGFCWSHSVPYSPSQLLRDGTLLHDVPLLWSVVKSKWAEHYVFLKDGTLL